MGWTEESGMEESTGGNYEYWEENEVQGWLDRMKIFKIITLLIRKLTT